MLPASLVRNRLNILSKLVNVFMNNELKSISFICNLGQIYPWTRKFIINIFNSFQCGDIYIEA